MITAVIARKHAEVPIFPRWPQQSDYAAAWASESRKPRVRPRDLPAQLDQGDFNLRGGGPQACVLLQHSEDECFQRRRDFGVYQQRPQGRLGEKQAGNDD